MKKFRKTVELIARFLQKTTLEFFWSLCAFQSHYTPGMKHTYQMFLHLPRKSSILYFILNGLCMYSEHFQIQHLSLKAQLWTYSILPQFQEWHLLKYVLLDSCFSHLQTKSTFFSLLTNFQSLGSYWQSDDSNAEEFIDMIKRSFQSFRIGEKWPWSWMNRIREVNAKSKERFVNKFCEFYFFLVLKIQSSIHK